ncbi:unnamed protein product [Durusdinium trenchii]|uniref:C3H1-type domain-containing protein n=1 Tax=Durusdinium trenchii TaxID=1381693 RepID=A0ABP0P9L3_9DINO
MDSMLKLRSQACTASLNRPPPGLEDFGPRAVGLVRREAMTKENDFLPSDASTTDTDSTSLTSRWFGEGAFSPTSLHPVASPSGGFGAQNVGAPKNTALALHELLEESASPRDDCPSIGSASHSLGLCKPCDFKCRSSCRFGYECMFCHICGPAESRKWKKHRKNYWNQAKAIFRKMQPPERTPVASNAMVSHQHILGDPLRLTFRVNSHN